MSTQSFKISPSRKTPLDRSGESAKLTQMLDEVRDAANRLDTEISRLEVLLRNEVPRLAKDTEFQPT